MELKEKVLKEIEHDLKSTQKILEKTDNKKDSNVYDMHLMALGRVMALNNLKYSILNDNWLFESGGDK